jgi:hypothetical protein
VGAEAACTVTVGRKRATGKALLETDEIIFRGDGFRLKIPLASITNVEAADGKLTLTYPDGKATFNLGPPAAKWATKIRNPKTRADKLGVKAGQRVSVLNVYDRGLLAELRGIGADVLDGKPVKGADAIFLGAETIAGLAGMRRLVDQITRDGCIWTVTPKGKGGVRDTDIMALTRAAGLVDVKVVAFSATHTANKFVIPKAAR